MAIIPSDTYPGQTDTSDLVAYPSGAAQNVIVIDDGVGFPLEKTWVNDLLGWQQALLAAAGITASGDPDTAVDSQYTQAIRLLAERSHASTNVQSVGVFGTGVADETAAIVAAQVAVAAAGGGWLFFPPGRYRITSTIPRLPNVYWHGVPGLSAIAMDHATADVFAPATGTYSADVLTVGLDFEADQTNTGKLVQNTTAGAQAKLRFVNCRVNSSDNKLTGAIYNSDQADTRAAFDYCTIRAFCTTPAFISTFGEVNGHRGKWTMAPAAADDLVVAARMRLSEVEFDQVSTLGGIAFLNLTGSFPGNYSIHDCICDVDDSAAGASTYFIRLQDDAIADVDGNVVLDDAILYKRDGLVAAGSSLQLNPAQDTNITGTDVTAGDDASFFISSENASPPAVTLSPPLFAGQRRTVGVRNISGGAWSGAIGFTSSVAVAYTEAGGLTDLADDEIVTINFEVMTLDTGLAWVQVGDASQHFVAS